MLSQLPKADGGGKEVLACGGAKVGGASGATGQDGGLALVTKGDCAANGDAGGWAPQPGCWGWSGRRATRRFMGRDEAAGAWDEAYEVSGVLWAQCGQITYAPACWGRLRKGRPQAGQRKLRTPVLVIGLKDAISLGLCEGGFRRGNGQTEPGYA